MVNERPIFRLERLLGAILAIALAAAACADDPTSAGDACFDDPSERLPAGVAMPDTDLAGTKLRLATHDSFELSPGTLEAFTDETGIEVEQVEIGDAGTLVSQAVITRDNPTADVLFGIDNTFLCRGLEADLFIPYRSPALADVPDELETDPFGRVTPISYGDVCVNYWIDALPGPTPISLDDLTDPVNDGQFVTQNPETSSPGFAFLLATVAAYGEDGWEDYWADLAGNDVEVTAGWTEAYYGDFIAGGGDRALVTSYASSPPADVLFADPPIDAPRTGVLTDSCFRQIEYAGILNGTEHAAAASLLIDFMLSVPYQEDIPLNMFVYPANEKAALPAVFVEFGPLADEPLEIDPAEIEANRDDWTARWNDIVLG